MPLCSSQPATVQGRRLRRELERMVVWWGTPIEARSAFARLVRDGHLTGEERVIAVKLLGQLRVAWDEILPTERVRSLRRPAGCTRRPGRGRRSARGGAGVVPGTPEAAAPRLLRRASQDRGAHARILCPAVKAANRLELQKGDQRGRRTRPCGCRSCSGLTRCPRMNLQNTWDLWHAQRAMKRSA